jgi:hypothetical protein
MTCNNRNTSTGSLLCTPRNDICWLPGELEYAPSGADNVYYQFCAH